MHASTVESLGTIGITTLRWLQLWCKWQTVSFEYKMLYVLVLLLAMIMHCWLCHLMILSLSVVEGTSKKRLVINLRHLNCFIGKKALNVKTLGQLCCYLK